MAVRVLPGFLTTAERAALVARADAHVDAFVGGRQAGGYQKHALVDVDDAIAAALDRARAALAIPAGWAFADAWLLRYPRGASIPPHVDPPEATGMQHVRLNAIVRAPRAGGVFTVDGAVVALAEGDAVVFRPDVDVHAVSVVDDGDRLVFSVGAWLPA
jgi:hypothetical protein